MELVLLAFPDYHLALQLVLVDLEGFLQGGGGLGAIDLGRLYVCREGPATILILRYLSLYG